jgi:hypothetical protein
VLVAPGPDTEKVIEFLTKIRDGALANRRELSSLHVTGRLSHASQELTEGNRLSVDPHVLPTVWLDFEYWRAGDLWRLDIRHCKATTAD